MTEYDPALREVVKRFEGQHVVVVGDLILDHYIWGKVDRISPEAPVVVVQVSEESRRPGGAGNVAKNLIELGARVSVCSIVGDDEEGRTLVSTLQDMGADVEGILVDRSRPTTIKTRVIAHAQQVVRVDRENTAELAQGYAEGMSAALQTKLADANAVVVSDYGKGAIGSVLFERIAAGSAAGEIGAGKVPVIVDPKAPNFSLYTGATVIKPNRKEAEEASGETISDRKSAIAVGGKLLDRWGCEMVLITLGEDGMVLVSSVAGQESNVEIDTVAREVYDVSGAGDTVSAVFTLALAASATPREAATLANLSAGIVVAEVGTVAVTRDQLVSVLESEAS